VAPVFFKFYYKKANVTRVACLETES